MGCPAHSTYVKVVEGILSAYLAYTMSCSGQPRNLEPGIGCTQESAPSPTALHAPVRIWWQLTEFHYLSLFSFTISATLAQEVLPISTSQITGEEEFLAASG